MSSVRKLVWDGGTIIGLTVIVLGIIFLLGNLFPDFSFWRFVGKFWPVAIIILGLYLVFNYGRFGVKEYSRASAADSRVVGDQHISYKGRELGSVNVSQVIGDMTIDLAGGILKPGLNQLNSSLVIGDLSILIPVSFPVKINAKSVIGDIKFDRRREEGLMPKLEHSDSNYESAPSKLLLNLNNTIGDITIQRV